MNIKNIFLYEIFPIVIIIIGTNLYTLYNKNKEIKEYNILKEKIKKEEEKYPYIEENIKYKDNYKKFNKKEYDIIIGIDFGIINTGYAYLIGNDISKIISNKKFPSEFGLSRITQRGKLYSSASSISLMNYRKKELDNFIYIKGIKSLLYPKQYSINNNNNIIPYIYPTNYLPKLNISNCLKEYFIMLKNDILKELNENNENNDLEIDIANILWVISIPSTWREYEKQLIKNSLIMSGMNNINFVYDSEAISLAMYYDKYIPDKFKKRNKFFMIVDAGGYSVDITVNEIIDKKGSVKEIINTTSDNLGINHITEQIIQILEEIYGKSYINKIRNDKPGEWIKILKDINQAIEDTYSIHGIEIFEINVINNKIKHIEVYIYTYNNVKYTIEYNRFSIIFPLALIGNIILNNIYYIKYNINEIINELNINNKNLDIILVMGGLSQNKIFKNEINDFCKINKINLEYLTSYETVISKGSVIYGIDTNKIKSRISPITIGIKNNFNNESMEILLKKGDEIQNTFYKNKLLKPILENQNMIQLNIYGSDNDIVNYTNLEQNFIGRLLIKMNDNKSRIIQLCIKYDTLLSFFAFDYENDKEIYTEFQSFK